MLVREQDRYAIMLMHQGDGCMECGNVANNNINIEVDRMCLDIIIKQVRNNRVASRTEWITKRIVGLKWVIWCRVCKCISFGAQIVFESAIRRTCQT